MVAALAGLAFLGDQADLLQEAHGTGDGRGADRQLRGQVGRGQAARVGGHQGREHPRGHALHPDLREHQGQAFDVPADGVFISLRVRRRHPAILSHHPVKITQSRHFLNFTTS